MICGEQAGDKPTLTGNQSIAARMTRDSACSSANSRSWWNRSEKTLHRLAEVFSEGPDGWRRADLPTATLGWCKKLAQLIATFSSQKINEQTPMLSGSLPDGQRVQVAMPPACELGTISITIRKPSLVALAPGGYEAAGFHDEVPDYPVTLDATSLARLSTAAPWSSSGGRRSR